ncbi:MAG: hypothetical protein OEV49_01230 [candidate division Zixibacteria bacterium]|nr:hypothetical protein [candidate division Zixibacteria bacterium]MDH3937187.1 hypothetical protein [candidate division Zixibacteria bacterium]MDH4032450.1 hypothetical protein [candidate division Zixibacteria bacterium]
MIASSPRLLLSLILVIGIVSGCGCNGDDPPQPPNPTGVMAVNGQVYKGVMGGSGLDQPLQFGVKNSSGSFVVDQWIHFSLLEGDGSISADSIKSGSDGLVTLEYNFSGNMGHATIRAIARNLDTLEVYLRADLLVPGDHGQGQYVLLDDTYGDIVDFNGPPVSLDVFPGAEILVANYEATMGVVFVIYDTDTNGVIEATSPIFSIIVVDSVYPQPPSGATMSARYEGTTIDGLGIGSHWWNEFIPIYGFPDFVIVDNSDPNLLSHKVVFDALHLTLWSRQSDSTVYQIDIAEEFDVSLFEAPPSGPAIDSVLNRYRR